MERINIRGEEFYILPVSQIQAVKTAYQEFIDGLPGSNESPPEYLFGRTEKGTAYHLVDGNTKISLCNVKVSRNIGTRFEGAHGRGYYDRRNSRLCGYCQTKASKLDQLPYVQAGLVFNIK